MSWFNKKEENKERGNYIPQLPDLPELPRLPELPEPPRNISSQKIRRENLPKLPSFPSSSLGEKFSRNAIKDAVAGEKEVEEDYEADDFDFEEEEQMMPKSSPKRIPSEFLEASKKVKSNEPVFIRLDKFEESMKTFEKAKEKIGEINSLLKDIKKLKDEEERELLAWETEIQKIKDQIEKVDQEIFSKI